MLVPSCKAKLLVALVVEILISSHEHLSGIYDATTRHDPVSLSLLLKVLQPFDAGWKFLGQGETQVSGHSEVETPSATPKQKHTTGGIPRWSPTLVLVARFSAYVWQSGRDAQFSLTYGRMY
jgi:hypothetical protein